MPGGIYPFEDPKPANFADGQRLSASHINSMKESAAAAADGGLWTDLALAHNLKDGESVANCGYSPIWSPWDGGDSGAWFTFGVNAGNPVGAFSLSNGDWASFTLEASVGLTPGAHGCSATDGAITIVGGTPGSSSTKKIRRSTQNFPISAGFGEWTAEDTVATGTTAVTCMVHHEDSGLFVIGLGNAASSNIETSPDGQVFTQRTASNSLARGAMATDGTNIVCLASSSTNQCITSTNGTSWNTRTLPATATWTSVVYDSYNDLFLAFSAAAWAWSDDGGVTWTAGTRPVVGHSLSDTLEIAGPWSVFGRLIVGWCSGNTLACGYVNDSKVLKLDTVHYNNGAAGRSVAAGAKQFLATRTTTHYRTARGGFFVTGA